MRPRHTLTRTDAKTYLRIGITPREVVRLRWPEASDEFADFVLWERTPYPLVSGLDGVADAVAEVSDERIARETKHVEEESA